MGVNYLKIIGKKGERAMDNKICKGCRLFIENDCDQAIKPSKEYYINCPCAICLIKGMCHDGCRPYKDYWKSEKTING